MAQAIAGTPSERNSRAMAIAAVVFAALAALFVFVALSERGGGGGGSSAATQDVGVAARDIGVNTTVTAEMLEVRAVETGQLLSGAVTVPAAAVGFPARVPIQKGEQVTATKLGVSTIEDEKDLALVIEPGQRGFSVSASEVTAAGGLILPGNYVDVIAVFDGNGDGGIEKAVTVLQNIQVLGVAQEAQEPVPAYQQDGAPGDSTATGLRGERPDDVERQPGARSITLSVTPDQAQLLALLEKQDDVELWLSLRPVEDKESLPLGETNLDAYRNPPPPQP